MMKAEQIVKTVQGAGGQLVLIEGKLKAKGLTQGIREIVKEHKTEIIQFLSSPPVDPGLKPCPLCNGRDFINSEKGGCFCLICQPQNEGQIIRAGGHRYDTKDNDPPWYYDEDTSLNINVKKKLPSFFKTAHQWIVENKLQLLNYGWTPSQLYRRNKSKGIAFLKIWDRPNLKVSIGSGGEIRFHFFNKQNNLIQQTSFPRR